MANVCLDITPLRKTVEREGWYEQVRADIEAGKMQVFIGDGKFKEEITKVEKVKLWIIEMSRSGRVKGVHKEEYKILEDFLKDHPTAQFPECDDQHIFAVARLAKIAYVFTEDKRLAKCKRKMMADSDCRNCRKFKIISREAGYKAHRQSMIS